MMMVNMMMMIHSTQIWVSRVTYQNKIFDVTRLLFIIAVLGSKELNFFFLDFSDPVLIPPSLLKDFLRLTGWGRGIKTGSEKSPKNFLSSMDPKTAMIRISSVKSKFLF